MRSDFARCVIERPRKGSSNRSLKLKSVGKFHHTEDGIEFDGPTSVPSSGNGMRMFSPKIGDKSFTDVLGPVEGYLEHSVGRRWDDIFSELSANLGSGSYPIAHVLHDHILRDVDRNTYWEDGKVYSAPGSRSWGHFYVHPLTGVLCREAYRSRKYKAPASKYETERVFVDGSRWYVRLEGIWYIGRYEESEAISFRSGGYRDVFFNRWTELEFPDFRRGAVNFRFHKIKQANKKELREMGRLQAKQAHQKAKLTK